MYEYLKFLCFCLIWSFLNLFQFHKTQERLEKGDFHKNHRYLKSLAMTDFDDNNLIDLTSMYDIEGKELVLRWPHLPKDIISYLYMNRKKLPHFPIYIKNNNLASIQIIESMVNEKIPLYEEGVKFAEKSLEKIMIAKKVISIDDEFSPQNIENKMPVRPCPQYLVEIAAVYRFIIIRKLAEESFMDVSNFHPMKFLSDAQYFRKK